MFVQVDDQKAAITALQEDIEDKTLLLTVVYKTWNGPPAATLVDPVTNDDIVKSLVTDGYLLVNREKRINVKPVNFYYFTSQKYQDILLKFILLITGISRSAG